VRRVQLRLADAGGGHSEEAAGARLIHSPGDEGGAGSDRTKDLYGLHVSAIKPYCGFWC
jgi:hypothetical protein